MLRTEKIIKKILAIITVCAIILGMSGFGGVETVSAAKKSSAKAVAVNKAKKGIKITSGNYIYKITSVSKKNSTVTLVGVKSNVKKKLKKVSIPKVIKIKSSKGKNKGTYSYKVTAISNNAFKNCKKLTNVKIGDNIITIGKNAFAGCVKLKKVTLGKQVTTIKESAFSGDKKLVEVVIPKDSKLETIDKNAFKGCVNLNKMNFDNASKIKKIDDSAFKDTKINPKVLEEFEEKIEAIKYSYEIIPLMAPFNSYFYIKTDNPDPDSFRFVDSSTVYAGDGETGSIKPIDTQFSDVKYENTTTKRVNGGYIAAGSNTDGGELMLQLCKITGTHKMYNLTTGETTDVKEYDYKDTSVKVKVDPVMGVVDYLIATYGDSSKSYFDNLSDIQKGFSSECLYSGVYVLGDLKKSDKSPYYGISTSPHVDQTFYIQDPYYRTDSKSMLVSALHPMRYDSIGFPSIMSSVAKKLNSAATVEWSSSAHYLINVTFNGETKTYGGAGSGGGQGIYENQVKYWYLFDGSKDDASNKKTVKEVADMICDYGKMTVPEEPRDLPQLTWASIRQTVGKDGAYVKLILLNSIFGGSGTGYTFMYDNGSTSEGSQGWGSVGHFSNAWYDGRYYNSNEYYYPGATFEDTVEKVQPALVMKNVILKLPDDGKTYMYNYKTLDKVDNYNQETGVWSGFTTYYYDKESKTWTASILNYLQYKEDNQYKKIENQDFIDACTITIDEAKNMEIDKNTNKEPDNYYIYDMVTEPGTYHSATGN